MKRITDTTFVLVLALLLLCAPRIVQTLSTDWAASIRSGVIFWEARPQSAVQNHGTSPILAVQIHGRSPNLSFAQSLTSTGGNPTTRAMANAAAMSIGGNRSLPARTAESGHFHDLADSRNLSKDDSITDPIVNSIVIDDGTGNPIVVPQQKKSADDTSNRTGTLSSTTPTPANNVLLIPLLVFVPLLICLCILPNSDDHVEGEEPARPLRNSAQRRARQLHTKTDQIFQAIDRDMDGFVSLNEFRVLAKLTDPKGDAKVTSDWFEDLCRPLGANPQRGLDRREFRQSYVLLGNDVDTDLSAIRRAMQVQTASSGEAIEGKQAAASLLQSAGIVEKGTSADDPSEHDREGGTLKS